ncbi:hypothetical protein CEXT_360791 [Caerostris extrusa]|uniref:Uncharacterized protein n=1 Tax=Caerostris extrusa TaxID=172846 RepID=A0AAV4Y5N7_CAEEX|nr:hypothetical protein CEXT_360791 [Caerostris extrusa]
MYDYKASDLGNSVVEIALPYSDFHHAGLIKFFPLAGSTETRNKAILGKTIVTSLNLCLDLFETLRNYNNTCEECKVKPGLDYHVEPTLNLIALKCNCFPPPGSTSGNGKSTSKINRRRPLTIAV